MARIFRYALHDAIGVEIIKDRRGIFDAYLDDRHRYHQVRTLQKPDLRIKIGFFEGLCESYREEARLWVRPGYIFQRCSHKIARWDVEIVGLEDEQTHLNIRSNLWGNLVYPGYSVDPMIRLKLISKSYPIVHASGVTSGGQAFVFAAGSGLGKTAMALHLCLKRGFGFLGDDMLILRGGEVYNYITPLNIFRYTANQVPLTTSEKLATNLRYLLYWMTRGYFRLFTAVDPVRVFSDRIRERGQLGVVCFLERGDDLQIKKMESAEAVQRLVADMKRESQGLVTLLSEYSREVPNSPLVGFWDRYTRDLKRCLQNAVCLKAAVPLDYSPTVYDQLLGEIYSRC